MIDKKVYSNSAKCPDCSKKMYYSRKGRVYFQWIGLVNKDNDVIEYYMCPFCNSIYDRWNGNKIEKFVLNKKIRLPDCPRGACTKKTGIKQHTTNNTRVPLKR